MVFLIILKRKKSAGRKSWIMSSFFFFFFQFQKFHLIRVCSSLYCYTDDWLMWMKSKKRFLFNCLVTCVCFGIKGVSGHFWDLPSSNWAKHKRPHWVWSRRKGSNVCEKPFETNWKLICHQPNAVCHLYKPLWSTENSHHAKGFNSDFQNRC